MNRNLWAIFLTWLLTIEASFAFALPASSVNSSQVQKNIEQVILNYNDFASGKTAGILPTNFSAEDKKSAKDYMLKNKISGILPIAKLTDSGIVELTMKGESTVLEINVALGTIRLNGKTLVLKSSHSLKSRLEQIENFLMAPKVTKLDRLLEVIFPSANADCLPRFETILNEKMPARKGVYKLPMPGLWVLAGGLFLAYLTPLYLAAIPVYFTMKGSNDVQDKDIAIRSKEEKVEADYQDLIIINGAMRIAKAGELPPRPSSVTSYNEDQTRFNLLYFRYAELSKKAGTIPLPEQDFLSVLAKGDKKENFCSPIMLDTIEKIVGNIMLKNSSLDPNDLSGEMRPITAILDEPRKDDQKSFEPIGSDKKVDSSIVIPK